MQEPRVYPGRGVRMGSGQYLASPVNRPGKPKALGFLDAIRKCKLMMKKLILWILSRLGYSLQKYNPNATKHINDDFVDIREQEFWDVYEFCKPYTMTSIERMYSLYVSVDYILSNNIPGAFVECGVWRGGSAMLIAKMLVNRAIYDRKIYLYDTFEGMSEPTSDDITWNGDSASTLLDATKNSKEDSVWCLASMITVKTNLALTNYNEDNIHYIEGKVEDTLPATLPDEGIALLRLDTDWYESTKHELKHLFPKVVQCGVLIVDDYGHWEGSRKATDEYFQETNTPILLNRIDYTGRVAIKPG